MKLLVILFLEISLSVQPCLASFSALYAQNPLGKTEFPTIEVTLDVTPLMEISKAESIDSVIAAIRKTADPKIVVLERFSKFLPKTNVVKSVNLIGDDGIAAKYGEVYGRKMEDEGVVGIFFPPFASGLGEFAHPYVKQPVIVLAKNATRRTLLHEYLHYLIWAARRQQSPQYFEQGGKVVHIRERQNATVKRFSEAFNRDVKAYGNATGSTEREQAWFKMMASLIEVQSLQLEGLLQSYGEETEVSHFLIEHHQALGITKEEVATELQVCAGNLQRWIEQRHHFLKQAVVRFTLEEIPTSAKSRDKAEVLQAQFEKVNSISIRKIDRIGRWYNSQLD